MPLPENTIQYIIYAIAVIAVAFHIPAVKRAASKVKGFILSGRK